MPGVWLETIAAVEVRQRKPENVKGVPRRNGRYAGRVRMEVVPDRSARSLCGFVEAAVEPGVVVVTDAWGGYAMLPDRGYRHLPVAAQGDPSGAEDFLPISHLIDLQQSEKLAPKAAITASARSIFKPISTSSRSGLIAVFTRSMRSGHCWGISGRAVAPTYDELYTGSWQHPKSRSENG